MLFVQVLVRHFFKVCCLVKGLQINIYKFCLSLNISYCPNKKCNTNSDFIFIIVRCSLTFEFMVAILTHSFASYISLSFRQISWMTVDDTNENHENWYLSNKNEFTQGYSMIICLRLFYYLFVLSHN